MKAKLFLVTLTLALATVAQASGPASSPKACAEWCYIVFCAGNQTCGYYTVNGQPRCGCHDPFVLSEAPALVA